MFDCGMMGACYLSPQYPDPAWSGRPGRLPGSGNVYTDPRGVSLKKGIAWLEVQAQGGTQNNLKRGLSVALGSTVINMDDLRFLPYEC